MGILRKRILARDQRVADNKAVFEDLVHSDIFSRPFPKKDRGRVNTIIHDLTGISMDVRI